MKKQRKPQEKRGNDQSIVAIGIQENCIVLTVKFRKPNSQHIDKYKAVSEKYIRLASENNDETVYVFYLQPHTFYENFKVYIQIKKIKEICK